MNSSSFQKLLAELLGVAAIVAVVIGASHMAKDLMAIASMDLLINAVATASVLVVIITIFGPISGAHFNPVVTLVMLLEKSISLGLAIGYLVAQLLGGVLGAVIANLMFERAVFGPSTNVRDGFGVYLGEVVATFGLVLLILLAIRHGKAALVPALVALWIVAGYFFTASSSFANPAVTFGRAFSDAGSSIAWESVLAFMLLQTLGALAALITFKALTSQPRK